jgi:hypothetical protein
VSESLGLRLQGRDSGYEFLVFVDLMALVWTRTSTPRTSYKENVEEFETGSFDTDGKRTSNI